MIMCYRVVRKNRQRTFTFLREKSRKTEKRKNIAIIDNFQTVVTSLFVDRPERSSYQKKGEKLRILNIGSRFQLHIAIMGYSAIV